MLAEENLREREMDLLVKNRDAENLLIGAKTLASKFDRPSQRLQKERRRLRAEISKVLF